MYLRQRGEGEGRGKVDKWKGEGRGKVDTCI